LIRKSYNNLKQQLMFKNWGTLALFTFSFMACSQNVTYQEQFDEFDNCTNIIGVCGLDQTPLIPEDRHGDIHLEKIADFDANGFDDVLVRYSYGASAGSDYQIFSFDGQAFVASSKQGNDRGLIGLSKRSDGSYTFEIETNLEGYNTEICQNKTEIFQLENGDFKRIQLIKTLYKKALYEVRSASFENLDPKGALTFAYDLNDDGTKDIIKFTYWERWGRMFFQSFEISGVGSIKSKIKSSDYSNPKRLGVLPTKTKGFYDLVFDCGTVLKWNGSTYINN